MNEHLYVSLLIKNKLDELINKNIENEIDKKIKKMIDNEIEVKIENSVLSLDNK